jgi:hypothetical protein
MIAAMAREGEITHTYLAEGPQYVAKPVLM